MQHTDNQLDAIATALLLLGAGLTVALYLLGAIEWELFVIVTFLLLLTSMVSDRLMDNGNATLDNDSVEHTDRR